MSPKGRTRLARLLFAAPLLAFALALTTCAYRSVSMPGSSYRGALPALTERQEALAKSLEEDVVELAGNIGERRLGLRDTLDRARSYIEAELAGAGYEASRETFEVRGAPVSN